MTEAPKAWSVFLSKLISESSDKGQADPLLLKDQDVAADIRDCIAAQLNPSDSPQVLVLDLGGSAFTPLALQELIIPLAQRIRGGGVWNCAPCHQHLRPGCWRLHPLYGASTSIAALSFSLIVQPMERLSSWRPDGDGKRHPRHRHLVWRSSDGVQLGGHREH